jgi:glycine betaine transporter
LILLFIFSSLRLIQLPFVLGMMTSKGDLNPPPALKKIAWGATQSFLAIALLFTGGLTAACSQTAIAGSSSLTVIMVLMCYALLKALGEEKPGQ